MKIRTKNWSYLIFFDFPGFGYVHITGNNHQRKMYFLGIATVEAIDKKEYPNIRHAVFTRNVFRDGSDGHWIDL